MTNINTILDKYGVPFEPTNPLDAADWTVKEDAFTQDFAERNQRQFWRPEEIPISNDILSFTEQLEKEEASTYMKGLAGLSLLDTEQGNVGMPTISLHTKGHQRKALLNWMGMMENLVHVKSYSGIFITLLNKIEIKENHDWVKQCLPLQAKTSIIRKFYNDANDDTEESYYKALVASVFLESFLFYSGFYYPILNYGQGRMMNSGDTINLILRDEAIHGVYTGILAQEQYAKFSPAKQKELDMWVEEVVKDLYEVEIPYTRELYDTLGLTEDALTFVKFNANTALTNIGKMPLFNHDPLNPIILNGLNTGTKSHDFFSQKSSSYINATIEELKSKDFDTDQYKAPWSNEFL